MSFISQSISDIQNKLQNKLDGVMSMPHALLVDIAYEVYNSPEYQKAKAANSFLNQIKGYELWSANRWPLGPH